MSAGGLLSRAQCSGGCRKLGPCPWTPLLKGRSASWRTQLGSLVCSRLIACLAPGLSSSQSQTPEFSCPSREASHPPPCTVLVLMTACFTGGDINAQRTAGLTAPRPQPSPPAPPSPQPAWYSSDEPGALAQKEGTVRLWDSEDCAPRCVCRGPPCSPHPLKELTVPSPAGSASGDATLGPGHRLGWSIHAMETGTCQPSVATPVPCSGGEH